MMKDRTKALGLAALRFAAGLPSSDDYRVIRNQLMRCATSIGANYRAACRGRSRAEFVSRLGIVEEEAVETMFWLELLRDLETPPRFDLTVWSSLYSETNEVLSIVVASIKSARPGRPAAR
jgi:four helix bundle protein